MRVKDIAICNPDKISSSIRHNFINYVDTSSVTSGVLNNLQQLDANYPSRAQREVQVNDILISSVRPVLLHNYFVKIVHENMIASTGFIQIRVKDTSKTNPLFLYYYLTAPSQVKIYTKIAETAQSSYPSFNKDVIEKLVIPDFDITEQLRIADITRNGGIFHAA